MSNPVPEFSRRVPLVRLGSEPFQTTIEATPEERERLAERFDLIVLDRLAAVVTLQRVNGELIQLDATFEAEFVQSCVVTLDPVPGRVAQIFSLVYAPLEEQPTEIDLDIDEPIFEPLTGDTIDIGEAVAQELSLALPDFPRLADASIDPLEAAEAEDSPFAALERLRRSLN